MTITELIEAAKNHVVTQKDIDGVIERMRLAEEKYVEKEIINNRQHAAFLNRTYTI